jgi:lysophospholipase L1-like esterase
MRSRLTPTLLLATTVAVLLALSGTAASGTSARPVYQPPQAYYLALGDSMAYGYQPTKAKAPPSAVHTGYVDRFAARLRKLFPSLQVVNYGCPGESAVTFARGGCDWLKQGGKLHDEFRGSQLKAAEAFLRAHRGKVSPITVTLWGNDLPFPLSRHAKQAPSAIASFGSRFTSILEQLRATAPNAEIIVTGAWNPEADRLAKGTPLYRSLDATIRRAAAASRARVANMFPALDGTGSVKIQQARLCRLTFYCSKGDPHPTDAGYRAMADAFMTASGYPRK